MANTTVDGSLEDPSLLDTYNAQPKVNTSYEVTPEFKAEMQASRSMQDRQAWLETPVEPTDYSTLSGKQNRTIRDSINLIVGEDYDLYSKPAITKVDYFERGFLDKNGKATQKGLLASSLIKKGVLNKDFTITDNGKFFTKEESEFFTQGNEEVTDYNSYFKADPSRYDKMLEWKKAKDLGLFNQDGDEEDKPFVDTVSETYTGLGDFLGLAGKTFQSGMRLTGLVASRSPIGASDDDKEKEIKRLKEEDQTRVYGFAEGAVENAGYSYLKINALAQKGLNYLQEKAGVLTKEQTEAYNTFNDYQAASLKNSQNKNKTVANLLEVAGIEAATELLNESSKTFGKERSEAIQQEGEQPGAAAGDFANVLMGPALKIVGATTLGGSRLLNSVVNAKRIRQVERIKDGLAKASLYETQANKLALEAKLFSDEAANAALLEREAIAFGDTPRAISHAGDGSKYTENAAVASQQAGNNANMARSLRETANVLENSLPPTFQSQVAKAGMVSAAVPLKAAGAVVDKFGSTLAFVDRGISAVTGTFGLDKARGLARAAGLFTGYINPYTIAEGVVASHKLWTGAGRLLNSLGENMLVNQGTNPFFRRVAADMATPVGRTFATAADTFIPPVVKGVSSIAKGVTTAATPSLIYRAINEQGLDANVFKQAAADALVFGAPLGFGAAIIGKHSDFKSARQADRADFNNKMKADPAQYEIYNSMVDPLTKDVISSFVAAYPETQIKFVTEGPSFQKGNTATLNVNAPRDIIPVIALHELKHTLANQFQLNDLIKQKMVGDKTRPGDIFTKDGVLDPEFIAFGKEYNRRMKAGGMEELGIEDMAIEFYTDKAAEVLKSDIISGEFTSRAKESQLSRSIKAHFSTLVNQVPIIKNIHLKTGGAIDKSGKLVTGSGLVSGGLTQSPVVQAMVRKMYRETAGLTRQTKVPDGATISNTRIPQSKSTREGINNGTPAVENVNKQSREAGVEIPAGALDPSTPRGRDGVPTPLQTKAIVDSGAIHPEHLATFPTLVAEMVPDSSATFMFEYRPATQGRTAQSQAGETFHHVKPAGVRVNKKGNVLIIGLDINLWDKNIKKVANSKAAKDIGYSERDIRTDAYEASKFHIKNQSPDPYFEGKYGREQALKRKSLVASTYGEMTKSQNNFNPLLSESGMSKADGVYRTFSLDDIKRVSRTNSTADLAFDPNNYYSLKINLMPEAPIVDRSGNIVENPVMKDFFENHLPSGQRFREKPMAPEAMDANAQRSYMPEDYRGQHTAPSKDGGSPLYNLTDTYPDDIYSSKASQYYGHWGDIRDAEAIRVIQSMKGKKNASVKIYRAVPKYDANINTGSIKEVNSKLSSLQRMAKSSPHLWDDPIFRKQIDDLESQILPKKKLVINSGDWVTTVKSYAKDHGESALNGNYEILSKTVKAKDIFTNGDSIFEWGYDPQSKSFSKSSPELISDVAKMK